MPAIVYTENGALVAVFSQLSSAQKFVGDRANPHFGYLVAEIRGELFNELAYQLAAEVDTLRERMENGECK
jgi:hypothetical protein